MRSGNTDNDPLLDAVYAERRESFARRYGKRIAGGIGCALIVSVFMHLPYIKVIILWACQIVIMIFGRPHGAETAERIEDKAIHVFKKVEQVARERHAEGDHPKPAGHLAAAIGAVPAIRKAKEEVHAVTEVAAQARAAKQGIHQGVEKITDTGEKVVDAIKNAGGKAKDTVSGGFARLSDAWKARQDAKEKALRDRLIVRARAVRVNVDESWSVTRLEAEVLQAEVIAWRKRWNARCPVPKCHFPLHISNRMKHERFRCPRCQQIVSASAALALGSPPMPRRR